jgi:membrane associated rhomboid family serine protease
MGIYDREYYRDETGQSGWFWGIAPACKTIILINVAVFLTQWVAADSQLLDLVNAQSRPIFERFQIWRLLTAAFVYGPHDLMAILFGMFFFWMVGREMESMYGTREFTLMYITAAVVSTLCWALVDYFGPNKGIHGPMPLGASGAVTATVVLYALYYPHREILLFFIIPVQMWLMLVIFLGIDVLMMLRTLQGDQSMSAFAAHLGGALYGYLYKTGDLRWSRLLSARRFRARPRLYQPDPRDRVSPLPSGTTRSSSSSASQGAARLAPATHFPEEQLDAKLDEVLAKIAREGRAGLSDEENRVLEEASRRARNRRSDRL